MTAKQLEQTRPWHAGLVTDAGYKPPPSLVSAGLTEQGQSELEALTGRRPWEVTA